KHPFVATSLYKAMSEAKDIALAKMRDLGALRYMLPGMPAELDEIDATFGGDPWPYGVDANRPTLEALVRYMAEQSLIKAPIPVDELFVPVYGQYRRADVRVHRLSAGHRARATWGCK